MPQLARDKGLHSGSGLTLTTTMGGVYSDRHQTYTLALQHVISVMLSPRGTFRKGIS